MSTAGSVATKTAHLSSANERQSFPARGPCRTLRKRETVFRHGDPATFLYYVTSGVVALQLFLKDGRRQLTELVLPGDFCGFAIDGRYRETAVALQPTVLSVIRQSDIERCNDAGLNVALQAGRQVIESHQHILTLGRMSAEERVCRLLLRLARALGEPLEARADFQDGPVHLRIPLTRGEMGDYLGLSLETICRTVSSLQKQGVIRAGPRQGEVTLLDLKTVHSIAG